MSALNYYPSIQFQEPEVKTLISKLAQCYMERGLRSACMIAKNNYSKENMLKIEDLRLAFKTLEDINVPVWGTREWESDRILRRKLNSANSKLHRSRSSIVKKMRRREDKKLMKLWKKKELFCNNGARDINISGVRDNSVKGVKDISVKDIENVGVKDDSVKNVKYDRVNDIKDSIVKDVKNDNIKDIKNNTNSAENIDVKVRNINDELVDNTNKDTEYKSDGTNKDEENDIEDYMNNVLNELNKQ